MSAYPDLTQLIGSRMTADDGTVVERAVSGKPRLRSYFPDVQLIAQIQHELDGTDKDAIWTHYLANRGAEFDFVYRADGNTYSVIYAGAPDIAPVAGTDRWRVNVNFVVVNP